MFTKFLLGLYTSFFGTKKLHINQTKMNWGKLLIRRLLLVNYSQIKILKK